MEVLGFGSRLPVLVTVSATPVTAVTILDDPADVPDVSVAYGATAYSVEEGRDVQVTLRLGGMPERAVEIPLVIEHSSGAVADDFSVPATVSFASSETERTIAFHARADDLYDYDETVTLGFGS